jgi:hypothetical protein
MEAAIEQLVAAEAEKRRAHELCSQTRACPDRELLSTREPGNTSISSSFTCSLRPRAPRRARAASHYEHSNNI